MPWLLYHLERDPVPIIQKVRWTPGPVWTGVEKSLRSVHWDLISCSEAFISNNTLIKV